MIKTRVMKNKGQVLIEYVLMLTLVVAIFFGIFNRFKDFVDDPEGAESLISPFKALPPFI